MQALRVEVHRCNSGSHLCLDDDTSPHRFLVPMMCARSAFIFLHHESLSFRPDSMLKTERPGGYGGVAGMAGSTSRVSTSGEMIKTLAHRSEIVSLVPIAQWRRLCCAARPSLKSLLLSDAGRADFVLPQRGAARRRAVWKGRALK